MSDAPLRGINGRHEWFWEPGDEENLYSVDALMDMYYKSVGRNSTLILGLTPNPDSLLPEGDVQRLQEWGKEIKRRFSTPIATTSGSGNEQILPFSEPTPVNHVIIQEEIAKTAEAIRAYHVQANVDGRWETVAEGTSVGHKRIQQFETVNASALRLQITESDRPVQIKQFSCYFVSE